MQNRFRAGTVGAPKLAEIVQHFTVSSTEGNAYGMQKADDEFFAMLGFAELQPVGDEAAAGVYCAPFYSAGKYCRSLTNAVLEEHPAVQKLRL
jgi:hypothetical protein